MSTWQRVPPALAALFDVCLPHSADVERRKMFGGPCAFVNGNMFAGLHEDRLLVRLPDEAAQRPCVILGKVMKQYALIENALDLSEQEVTDWIARGYRFGQGLPPKAKKAKKAGKAGKAGKAVAKEGRADR